MTRADGTVRAVDFGARGMSDYTRHGDPHRMASYVRRHGARVDLDALRRRSPRQVHRAMGRVRHSDREAWADPTTPGYWSRWLLWSEPTLAAAARGIRRRDGFPAFGRAPLPPPPLTPPPSPPHAPARPAPSRQRASRSICDESRLPAAYDSWRRWVRA